MGRKKQEKTHNKAETSAVKSGKKAETAKNPPETGKKTAITSKTAGKTAKTAAKAPAKKSASKTPKKPRRRPHATRPTIEDELRIKMRRLRVLELKINGASVRRISQLLQAEGFTYCSPATVQSDLDAILDEINEKESLEAMRYRTLMIERSESQYFRVVSSMIQDVSVTDPATGRRITERKIVSDPEKENLLLRNMAFLDKLVGASKAEQSKNRAREALAMLLGVEPDELPDPDELDNDDINI
jgi:hypothetical protein